MKLDFEVSGDTLVVRVRGDLDLVSAESFRREVDRQMNERGTQNLLVNLGGVDFLDSAGLGAILGRYKRINARGGRVAIVGANPSIRRVLEISGVTGYVGLYRDETSAVLDSE